MAMVMVMVIIPIIMIINKTVILDRMQSSIISYVYKF